MRSTQLRLLLSAGMAGVLLAALPLGFDGSTFSPVKSQAWAEPGKGKGGGGNGGKANANGHADKNNHGAEASSLGALNAAFADKLRKVGAPTDMTDTVARINFVSDLGQFAEDYDRQAGIAHQAAVETAALLPSLASGDAGVSGWIRASCEALSYLDPTAKAELAACN